MIKLIFILLLVFTSSSFSDEISPFSSTTIHNKEITLIFKEQGLRYKIVLNEDNLGISGYGQVLVISKTDSLKLFEKHYSYLINYLNKEGKDYLNINMTGHHPVRASVVNQAHLVELTPPN